MNTVDQKWAHIHDRAAVLWESRQNYEGERDLGGRAYAEFERAFRAVRDVLIADDWKPRDSA